MVTKKGLLVTIKRLSPKDETHPNPLCSLSNVHLAFECPPDILIEPLSTPIRGISLLPVAVTS